MSRNPVLKKQRNALICQKYIELSEKKEGGVQLYRHEAILVKLSKIFFLEKTTIERIVSGNDGSKKVSENPNQLDIETEIAKTESGK